MATARREMIDALVAAGVGRDRAVMYVDAFAEYREASANIAKNGLIVEHPRTRAPLVNPYVAIRDRALAKLSRMGRVPAGFLWVDDPGLPASAPAVD